MTPITVNGTAIPSPDMPFKWTLNDISSEDSGRDLNGRMDKDEVAKKVTLDCTWSHRTAAIFFYLSSEDISLIEKTVHLGLSVHEKIKEMFLQLQSYVKCKELLYLTKTF